MGLLSCPPEKIRNPKTNRCVLKNGKIGKMIINKRTSISSKSSISNNIIKKDCPPEKIMNPKTKRCVLKNGKIGKMILDMNDKDNSNSNSNNFNILNENNSCFLDSLLVAFFHFKNKEIFNLFFNSEIKDFNNPKLKKMGNLIKKELFNIYSFIHKSNHNENEEYIYCSLFRKLLQYYYDIYIQLFPKNKILYNSNDNWIRKQIDIFELLNYLSIIFDFKSKKMTKIIDGQNKVYSNFIIEIPVYELIGKKKLNINELFPSKTERYELDDENKYRNSRGELISFYEKRREYIKTSSFIYFQIYRNMGSEEKIRTSIEYPEEIKIKENSKNLKIKSLIIHLGESVNSGHYITIIKRRNKWYIYNDMERGVKEISENRMREYKKDVVGMLYSN
jgi:hypothetical protein